MENFLEAHLSFVGSAYSELQVNITSQQFSQARLLENSYIVDSEVAGSHLGDWDCGKLHCVPSLSLLQVTHTAWQFWFMQILFKKYLNDKYLNNCVCATFKF
jgi:hypothetical protein